MFGRSSAGASSLASVTWWTSDLPHPGPRPGRAARRRRDRWWVGGPLRAQRRRRRPLRPRSRCGAQGRRGARQRPAGLRPPDRRAAAEPKARCSSSTVPTTLSPAADFVQESAPERLALKQAMLAGASRAADASVVFGSSTSGLLPTELQRDMDASRAARRRSPVQPGLPPAARRDRRRRGDRRHRHRSRRRRVPVGRDAAARRAQGDRRVHRRPAARGAVARGAVAGERRRGDGVGDRRRDPLRRRPAVELHGDVPHLPDRRAARQACGTSWSSSARRCSGRGRS